MIATGFVMLLAAFVTPIGSAARSAYGLFMRESSNVVRLRLESVHHPAFLAPMTAPMVAKGQEYGNFPMLVRQ